MTDSDALARLVEAWKRVQDHCLSEYDIDLGTLKAWDDMESALTAAQAALGAEPPMCYWHAHRVEVINGLRYHVVKTNRRNYLCLCAVEEGRWNAVAGEQAALAPPLIYDPAAAPTSGPPGRYDDDALGAGEATSRDTSGELYSVRTMKAQVEIWKAEMDAVVRERDDVKRVLEYTRSERNQAETRVAGLIDTLEARRLRIAELEAEAEHEERYHNGFRDDLWAALGVTEFKRLSDADQIQAVADLRASLQNMTDAHTEMKHRHDDAVEIYEQALADLRRRIAELEAINGTLENVGDDLRARLAACQGQLINAGANVARYMDRLAACESRLADTPENVERVAKVLDKLDALSYGPRHTHWDPTGQSGIGCQTCAYERERKQNIRALLAEARAALAALRNETPRSGTPETGCVEGASGEF